VRVVLDSNILLRLQDAANPFHAAAVEGTARLHRRGDEVCICQQNLVEFWAVATRPVSANGLGLAGSDVRTRIEAFRSSFQLLPDPLSLLDDWLDLVSRYDVSGKTTHDARIAAFAVGHGIPYLLTLNASDFARYAEIQVIDPRDPATLP
jgi:predicted nucleic acid-binding protein